MSNNNNQNQNQIKERDPIDVPAESWDWDEEYAIHKHCQKTVCSAYGFQGSGKTWDTIDTLTLENLQSILNTRSPVRDWKSYFKHSQPNSNITDDLAAILQLIEIQANEIIQAEKSFILAFTDINNNNIDSKTITPKNGGTYTFKIGRTVTIKAGSRNLVKFNTAKAMGTDQLQFDLDEVDFKFGDNASFGSVNVLSNGDGEVSIPYKEIDFKLNGSVQGSLYVATQDSKNEINFWRDRNRLFASTWQSSHADNGPFNRPDTYWIHNTSGIYPGSGFDLTGIWICPQWDWHVERLRTTDTSFNLHINARNYGIAWQGYSRGEMIIEFELHITNGNASSYISIANPNNPCVAFLKSNGGQITSNGGRFTVTSLTDNNTIAPGKTNVYVYRIDTYRMSIVRSLAYIY